MTTANVVLRSDALPQSRNRTWIESGNRCSKRILINRISFNLNEVTGRIPRSRYGLLFSRSHLNTYVQKSIPSLSSDKSTADFWSGYGS